MTQVLIALGANLAAPGMTPVQTLTQALALLAAPDLAVTARSRWYRSPAYPPGSGPDFVNGAAALASDLGPEAILARLHGVEAALGRTRPSRWAPRLCDLDLIAVGQTMQPDAATLADWIALDRGQAQRVTPPHLILPHPRLAERAFVLRPLADVAPDWCHPLTGLSVAAMLAAVTDDLTPLE